MKTLRTLAFLLAAACWTAATAQFTLDGRRPVLDSLSGTWLCSVPKALFGSDAKMAFRLDEGSAWTDVAIDGIPVANGDSVAFDAIAGGKTYTVTAHDNDSTITASITFTYHPILELRGDFGYDYTIGHVIRHLPDQEGADDMLAKLKWRGATTNTDGKHKRNYHIKFVEADSVTKQDRSFFGLRSDNSWILDAGQVDMSRLRNRIATEIWNDFATKPYYADREPDALSGVRGDVVEIVLNGKYNGFYCLTEAMDRKQLKLKKYDEDDQVFRGMLWKAVIVDEYTRMRRSTFYPTSNNNESWGGYEVKYPDFDDVAPTDYSTLHDAVDFVANSTNEEFDSLVGEYFDLPVLIDYWILINALHAVDNGIKNIYWACYNQLQDKKITLAVWDLDCTVGQNWTNYPFRNPNTVGPTVSMNTFSRLYARLTDRNSQNFSMRAVERYRQLRETVLNTDSLVQRYTDRLQGIINSGAAARETARWSKDTDIQRQRLDFEDEINYIANWIPEHMTFLDNKRFRPYVRGDINRDGVVDIGDLDTLIGAIFRPDDYPLWYEDLSPNGLYDVADINVLVNIILGFDTQPF